MAIPPDYLKIRYVKCCTQVTPHSPFLPFANSELYFSKIINKDRLAFGNDVKTVYDIALSIEGISHRFKPGDAIGILPNNDDAEVSLLIERLNLTQVSNQYYELSILENTTKKKAKVPAHIPISSTLKNIFTQNLNIRSVPKKLFLLSLSKHTTNPEEIIKFTQLCAPKSSEYEKFVLSDGKTLLTLLNAFPHCHPPIECLLEHLPALLPRYYSIASSPSIKNVLNIVFSVIENDSVKGVCSGWLEKLCIYESPITIPFYFRTPGTFLLFENIERPVIMIGIGTGVAPFIGLLQEIFINKTVDYGHSTLFFGCRNQNDYLYKDTLQKYLDYKILSNLFVAFSRVGEKKIYVQDKIKERSKIIVEQILNEGAYICVCGDIKNMEKDVEKKIVECIAVDGNLTVDEANNFIKELKKNNRYQIDVWN